MESVRPAREHLRWVVALGSAAVAGMRPGDVSPRNRGAHRLGYAAANVAVAYAQSHPATTGRASSYGKRGDAAFFAGVGLAAFLGYDWLNRLAGTTDAWLERRGVGHPRILGGVAAAVMVGVAYLFEDATPEAGDDTVEVDLPSTIRDAVGAVLAGLEERDPATAAALHQQLRSATTRVLADEGIQGAHLLYFGVRVADEESIRAVPHEQTVAARGRFTREGLEHEISIGVSDGRMSKIMVANLEWEWPGTREKDDDNPSGYFRLADWPEPKRITVVHDEP